MTADLKEYRGGWDFTTPEQFKVQSWPEIDGKKIPGRPAKHFRILGYYRDEQTGRTIGSFWDY